MKFEDLNSVLHFHWICAIIVLLTAGQISQGYSPPEKDIFIIEEDVLEDITCWTCPNKSDNQACNNWAPDIQCPFNHTVCKTIHHIHILNMESIRVSKVCAPQHECTEHMIGCFETDSSDVMECVSCCSTSYCNEVSPRNHTMAIFLSSLRRPPSSSSRGNHPGVTVALVLPLFVCLCLVIEHVMELSSTPLEPLTVSVSSPRESRMINDICGSAVVWRSPRGTRRSLDRRRKRRLVACDA